MKPIKNKDRTSKLECPTCGKSCILEIHGNTVRYTCMECPPLTATHRKDGTTIVDIDERRGVIIYEFLN
jgi:ribosomal protein S27AE